MERYYFDTSIWLNFFEKRNEFNLPKGEYTEILIKLIIRKGDKVIISDILKNELLKLGYLRNEIENMFFPLRRILIYFPSNKKQFKRAKDLSKKRNIPLLDAMHALLARDQKAIMITRDKHFLLLRDIITSKRPEEIT